MARPTLLLLLAIAVFAGCATVANAPVGTSAQNVEREYGPPYRIWTEAAGAATWEYPMGPEGKFTYMARLDANGRLVGVDQVLSDAWFAQVQPGMNERDIEHLLGRPYGTETFSRLHEVIWAWRFHNVIRDRCFYVHFDQSGKVVTTTSSGDERGGLLSRPC